MSKLLIIANRLPVTSERTERGIENSPSVGGLATGMSSLKSAFDCVWIGTCAMPIDDLTGKERKEMERTLLEKHSARAIFLTAEEIKRYYDGVSNQALWPLFHYFPYYTQFDNAEWKTYRDVNRKFLEAIRGIYQEGDLIWIQDYHLTLLPKMIRDEFPLARVGFFLHIPFPAFEIFRLLPWRHELLEGLMGADLVGFHSPSYVMHFQDNIGRILGIENHLGEFYFSERSTKVQAFPMGIDSKKFQESSHLAEVKENISRYGKETGTYRVILSVDRLDYTKGILDRIMAFDLFIESHPQYREKVIWIIIAVPSRRGVESYIQLSAQVNELIGRVNGKYATVGWTPIRYINRSISFAELCALYAISEIALITPLRDGMNLVAKEYVACKADGNGVLILSEMTGVSEELGEAIIVNPFDKAEIAEAIRSGFVMGSSEKRERMRIMQERIRKHDVHQWAGTFIETLANPMFLHFNQAVLPLDEEQMFQVSKAYHESKQRVLILDYDGTLVPFKSKPEDVRESLNVIGWFQSVIRRMNPIRALRDATHGSRLRELLRSLSNDPKNQVVIASGRTRPFLDGKFKHEKLTLIAEHGAWVKPPGGAWVQALDPDMAWMEYFRPMLTLLTERTPGSLVEEKDFSLAWHYRQVAEPLAGQRVLELKHGILNALTNMNLTLLEGNKVLEIKNSEVNKGNTALRYAVRDEHDFVLTMGDDRTDEDLFKIVRNRNNSIKIGQGPTSARFRLDSDVEVRGFLARLVSQG